MELSELPIHILDQILDNLDLVSLHNILDCKIQRISDLACFRLKQKYFGDFFYTFKSVQVNRKIHFTQEEATVWNISETPYLRIGKLDAKDVIIEFNSSVDWKKAVEARKKGLKYPLRPNSTLAALSKKEFVEIFSALAPNGPWTISVKVKEFFVFHRRYEEIYGITVFNSS